VVKPPLSIAVLTRIGEGHIGGATMIDIAPGRHRRGDAGLDMPSGGV
jgi:hypothetical protein